MNMSMRLGINQATIYRWFRTGPPPGYVRARVAERRLSLSRQSIWLHIKSGRLEACHVTRGKRRGLYVRIPDMPPLLPEASHDAHSQPGR